MAQQRSTTALEPYLALAPSATSPHAAADLITQATSAPHAYSFAELLQTPNIQALRSAESSHWQGYLQLLEIFAWGSWRDYESTPNLPKLNAAQAEKLRLLSLLSLVSSTSNAPNSQSSPRNDDKTTTAPTLSYEPLLRALSLPSPSALESLTTAAIYSDTLSATLDPDAAVIAVRSVAPVRDLRPGSVPAMKATTDAWLTRCENVVEQLEARVETVRQKARERARREKLLEARLNKAVDAGGVKVAKFKTNDKAAIRASYLGETGGDEDSAADGNGDGNDGKVTGDAMDIDGTAGGTAVAAGNGKQSGSRAKR